MVVYALVTDEPIDVTPIEEFVQDPVNGAVVTFSGVIRDHDDGRPVTGIDYEAHPEAQRFLEECCEIVAAETGLRVAAAHRTGSLVIGDIALVASVAAPHRAEAFTACARVVELIKLTVPIWKRQHLAVGDAEWVGI
ncbi:MAG: molybdenum cofactor biosynthesis protein MoaE [Salinibacterium sp.]|nr:molybdenum cofactor biosynthesis protein MoaE [Salinibacterium sp.]